MRSCTRFAIETPPFKTHWNRSSRFRVSTMDIHTYVNVKLLLSPRQSRGFTFFN